MAGYVLVDVEITNEDGYAEYRAKVQSTIEAYGGEFLVRAGRHEILEGEWRPKRLVLLRFDSLDRAKAWYSSAEYAAVLPLRLQNARASVVLWKASSAFFKTAYHSQPAELRRPIRDIRALWKERMDCEALLFRRCLRVSPTERPDRRRHPRLAARR